MVVPFSNRASVATLPELALRQGPASVKEIIDDFAKQCERSPCKFLNPLLFPVVNP